MDQVYGILKGQGIRYSPNLHTPMIPTGGGYMFKRKLIKQQMSTAVKQRTNTSTVAKQM